MPEPAMLSAGVVLVRCEAGVFRYLLLRAYKYWDFPKGGVEPNEGALDAALREVKEETGLDGLEFRWGDVYRETEPYARAKIARYYLAYSKAGAVRLMVNSVLGRPEHHEYRWLSYADARPLLGPRVGAVLDWAQSVIGERCDD